MSKLFILVGAALIALLATSSSAAAKHAKRGNWVKGTTCNETLTGANVPRDLVVPEDGTCIISATTVGGDVKVGKNGYFEADASQISGGVTSYRGQTVFINTGSTVGGDVGVSRAAQVFLFNSTLNGGIQVSRSTDKVHVCGNQIDGRVEIAQSGPDILFGDTLPGATDCLGNTVENGHSANLNDNYTDNELVIAGNTIQGGDLRVIGNRGPSDKLVENNTGGDDLSCWGNENPFTSSGNTGWDDQRGQCEIPPTECNGTLTGQTIPGDLIVPENGSCTIGGTTVGEDVKVGKNAYFESGTSQIGGDVKGKRALTVFVNTGSAVGGEVKAWRTFQVFVFNSSIGGASVSRSGDKVQFCGNRIDGGVDVERSARDILFGDPQAVDCGANTVKNGHSVNIEDNWVDVELIVGGNAIQGGDLRVNDNSGPADKFVRDNTGGDELSCRDNEDPFTASGNTGFAESRGQCEIPPTECNGTLTGQTIPGDLVVPEDGSCTLQSSTVGEDVKVGRNAYFQSIGSQIGGDVKGYRSLTVFVDTGSTVGGEVKTWRTSQVFVYNSSLNAGILVWRSTDKVQICGNQIDGNASVTDSSRDILVGDPQAAGCAGNTVKNSHSLSVEDNWVDVELIVGGNAIQGGDLQVNDNSGPAGKFVRDNTGGDELSCRDNEDPFASSGNTGFANSEGQCA
jgi:hypothetical protein